MSKNIVELVCGYNFIAYIDRIGCLYITSHHDNTPRLIAYNVIAVSCSLWAVAYITSIDGKKGTLYCYGKFLKNLIDSPKIKSQFIANDVTQISCGKFGIAYITAKNKLYALGYNIDNQYGLGILRDEKYIDTPTLVAKNVIQVSCGYHHMAYITAKRNLYVCGSNLNKQFGNIWRLNCHKPFKLKKNVDYVICSEHCIIYIKKRRCYFDCKEVFINPIVQVWSPDQHYLILKQKHQAILMFLIIAKPYRLPRPVRHMIIQLI